MSKLMNEHDVSVLEVRDKCISIGIKATKIIIVREVGAIDTVVVEGRYSPLLQGGIVDLPEGSGAITAGEKLPEIDPSVATSAVKVATAIKVDTIQKPKHAGGRPRKAVKAEEQPKKKRGRPRKVVEVSPLTVGEEAKAPSKKAAKIAEPNAQVKVEIKPVTAEVPTYHEPCKTCRKSRRTSDGEYPVCDSPMFETGPSGIETCALWWERR